MSAHSNDSSCVFHGKDFIAPRFAEEEFYFFNFIKVFSRWPIHAFPMAHKKDEYIKSLAVKFGWAINMRQHITINACIFSSSLISPIRW